MVRRIPSKQRNARLAREVDRGALVRLALLLLCGLTLAGGFVYAGGQHFAALRFGYQTENLRKVRSELAEDQHRLILEREAAASPARLERAAHGSRRLGLPLRSMTRGAVLARCGSPEVFRRRQETQDQEHQATNHP